MNSVQNHPKAIEYLIKYNETDDIAKEHERLEIARKQSDFVKKEIAKGYPFLHAWSLVNLCTLLEALIRDFIAEWLKNNTNDLKKDEFSDLRIKFSEYELIPEESKYLFYDLTG